MRGDLTGVIAAVLGNVVIALGLNFQKLCHIQIEGSVDRDRDTDTEQPSPTNPLLRVVHRIKERVQESLDRDAQYLSHPTFWLGLALTTIGESSNFIAYGLSPAPLVAPLGSCALVANCLFSPLLLGESFGLQEVVGSALCIIGAFVLIASNTGRDGKVDYDTLLDAIRRPAFQLYLLTVLISIGVLMALSNKRIGRRTVTVDVAICSLLGGLTVISTKVLSSLLVKDFTHAFYHQLTYVALAVLLFTAAAQVHFLNKALNKFDSKLVIPVQYIFFTISVIVASSMLFNDIKSFPYLTLLSGLTVSFCGVYFLSCAPQSDHFRDRRQSGSVEDTPVPGNYAHTQTNTLTPQRIQNQRSNSSFTKVGIGLSPARYLLAAGQTVPPHAAQSPDRVGSTSGVYREGLLAANAAAHDEQQALLEGRLPHSYDRFNSYSSYGSTIHPEATAPASDGRRSSTIIPTFSSSFLVNHPAASGDNVAATASPRSKVTGLFAVDHLPGSWEDGEATPRAQYKPAFDA
ncbi:hypothetical protein E3P99_00043 [Wallemia hederae]|uniref:Uncharacterized protein n=1 Tax=Wallemia hederae TaxID=1540922 RepID=A0A4T0FX45_9BASI|nr:hypothetical protein E3P99_00043 [Wallemia hederae]